MGNKLCCEQEPKKEFDHTITVVHKQEVVKIPELNPVVRQHLDRQKPFINQLTTRPSVKQFGLDVYQGKVDERGRPNGYGKMYHKSGSVFIGQFVAGVANGEGHFVKPDGSYYHGRMKNNMANDANGHYWSPKFEYRGEILDNEFNGNGRQSGQFHSFVGNYNRGRKVNGVLIWKQDNNQYKYEGGFNSEQNFDGKGTIWQKGKGTYTGDFVNGSKHGQGVYNFESGLRYEGEYYHNYKQGSGKLINKNGQVAYEGEFKKGMPHGRGKAPNRQGQLQERNWVEGIDRMMIEE